MKWRILLASLMLLPVARAAEQLHEDFELQQETVELQGPFGPLRSLLAHTPAGNSTGIHADDHPARSTVAAADAVARFNPLAVQPSEVVNSTGIHADDHPARSTVAAADAVARFDPLAVQPSEVVKIFGLASTSNFDVYRCPDGHFITGITLRSDTWLNAVLSFQCRLPGVPGRVRVDVSTGPDGPGTTEGIKATVTSTGGFDGAIAGYTGFAFYQGVPRVTFTSAVAFRAVNPVNIKPDGGWTRIFGVNNLQYPLVPWFCPESADGKTTLKITGLLIGHIARNSEVEGLGVICRG